MSGDALEFLPIVEYDHLQLLLERWALVKVDFLRLLVLLELDLLNLYRLFLARPFRRLLHLCHWFVSTDLSMVELLCFRLSPHLQVVQLNCVSQCTLVFFSSLDFKNAFGIVSEHSLLQRFFNMLLFDPQRILPIVLQR